MSILWVTLALKILYRKWGPIVRQGIMKALKKTWPEQRNIGIKRKRDLYHKVHFL